MFCRLRKIVKITTSSGDRKSTRPNSSHLVISYAVFCLKKKIQYLTHCNDHTDIAGQAYPDTPLKSLYFISEDLTSELQFSTNIECHLTDQNHMLTSLS